MSWTPANQISNLYSQDIRVEGTQREQPVGEGLKYILSNGNWFEQDGAGNLIECETDCLDHDRFIKGSVSPEGSREFRCDGKTCHSLSQVTCAPLYGQRGQAGSSACGGLASRSRNRRDVITALKTSLSLEMKAVLVPHAHWPFPFNGI